MIAPPLTRRSFLKSSAGAALAGSVWPTILPNSVWGADDAPAPSQRLGVGCIGVGPQGSGVMGNFLNQKEARVLAVCDVRRQHAERACEQVNQHYGNKDCRMYADFRELLARKDIDVVLIATPDHWHVPVAIAAARAGKDMYLEKPMGLSLAEDQLLRRAIQDHGRVFQFGTQQRSSQQFRQACELTRNGRIGQLKHIDVWCSASRPGGSTRTAAVPEGLDYEFWLGPAPQAPYTENKCDWDSTKTWWYHYDYALGFIAGWGVHPLDIAFWGTDSFTRGLVEVEGAGVFPSEGACNTSVAWKVEFKCSDGVTLTFKGTPNGYNEKNELTNLEPWRQKYGKIVDHGTAFVGSEGWVLVDRTQIRAHPEKLVEDKLGPNDVPLMRSSNHVRNLLEAVKSRGKTICPIEDAVQADILCHLSDLATRLKRKLTWDPDKERFVNDDEANRRLALRQTRAPWGSILNPAPTPASSRLVSP